MQFHHLNQLYTDIDFLTPNLFSQYWYSEFMNDLITSQILHMVTKQKYKSFAGSCHVGCEMFILTGFVLLSFNK